MKIVKKYKHVFERKPGLHVSYHYKLRLKDKEAFFAKPYPVPLCYREEVEAEIQRMLNLGVIRESYSPFINPLRVVIKKMEQFACVSTRAN